MCGPIRVAFKWTEVNLMSNLRALQTILAFSIVAPVFFVALISVAGYFYEIRYGDLDSISESVGCNTKFVFPAILSYTVNGVFICMVTLFRYFDLDRLICNKLYSYDKNNGKWRFLNQVCVFLGMLAGVSFPWINIFCINTNQDEHDIQVPQWEYDLHFIFSYIVYLSAFFYHIFHTSLSIKQYKEALQADKLLPYHSLFIIGQILMVFFVIGVFCLYVVFLTSHIAQRMYAVPVLAAFTPSSYYVKLHMDRLRTNDSQSLSMANQIEIEQNEDVPVEKLEKIELDEIDKTDGKLGKIGFDRVAQVDRDDDDGKDASDQDDQDDDEDRDDDVDQDEDDAEQSRIDDDDDDMDQMEARVIQMDGRNGRDVQKKDDTDDDPDLSADETDRNGQ